MKLTTGLHCSLRTPLVTQAMVLLALVSSPATAAYTGLVIIPTADTVDRGEYSIELQFDLTDSDRNTSYYYLNTEYGFSKRFEAGIDVAINNYPGRQLWANMKYRLMDDTSHHPALAIGVFNVRTSITRNPYIVSSHGFRLLNAHFGVTYINNSTEFMAGVDSDLSKRLTIMADFISGQEDFLSVGGNYQFSSKFGVLAGVQFPNSSLNATTYTIHFVFD